MRRQGSGYPLSAPRTEIMQNEQVRETAADEVCASRVLSGQIEVDDPCVHECSSRPWELMSTALDRGPFGNRKVYLATASVIVYQESFRSRTRLSGLSPAGMLGLSIPLRSADQGCYWGRAPRRGFIPSMLPGGLDVVMDAKQAHVVVLIALDLLRRSLPEDAISALARSAATHEVPISPVYLEGLTVWLLELLALAQHPPNGLRAEAIAQRVEDELPWRLSCACQAALSFPARVDYSARRLALDRAIGYLRDADLTSVTVAELCRVAGVKQRTLE
jgi:hypothetical protein